MKNEPLSLCTAKSVGSDRFILRGIPVEVFYRNPNEAKERSKTSCFQKIQNGKTIRIAKKNLQSFACAEKHEVLRVSTFQINFKVRIVLLNWVSCCGFLGHFAFKNE